VPHSVLLVDLGPAVRTVVRLHLADGTGFAADEFIEAGDLAGAREVLRSRAVQLVIAEVAGGGGAKAIEQLREASGQREVPMVVVASHPAQALAAAVRGAPCCALVEKPVTAPRLRAALRAVLGGKGGGGP
jgi:CheY-like chemotaxis protein